MLTFAIYLFSFFLVLDCLLLGLLIMIQLPKKEAGVGVAFGGGATDALFGAGSGTALSNLTKYTSTAFFILVFALSVMNNHARHAGGSDLKRQLDRLPAIPATVPQAATAASSAATAPAISSNATGGMPLTITTNLVPAATTPASNAAEAPAK